VVIVHLSLVVVVVGAIVPEPVNPVVVFYQQVRFQEVVVLMVILIVIMVFVMYRVLYVTTSRQRRQWFQPVQVLAVIVHLSLVVVVVGAIVPEPVNPMVECYQLLVGKENVVVMVILMVFMVNAMYLALCVIPVQLQLRE